MMAWVGWLALVVGIIAMAGWDAYREPRRRRAVLCVLAGNDELGGMDIVRKSNGKLGRGGIYVILSRMDDNGLIASRVVTTDWGMRRRLYSITQKGANEVLGDRL